MLNDALYLAIAAKGKSVSAETLEAISEGEAQKPFFPLAFLTLRNDGLATMNVSAE